MNEEKIYQFNDYVLSYDKSLSDRSCLTISKIQNSEMYLMGELFDGSADVVSMILDSLQTTVNYCKQENARLKDKIEKLNDYVEDRISTLTVSVDNKAKDEYFNNKCIGGVQELKNVKVILKEN